jgi:hypothetical protein
MRERIPCRLRGPSPTGNPHRCSERLPAAAFDWKMRQILLACARIEWSQITFRNDFTQKGSTLADLYDPLTMPSALVEAYRELDRAVDQCYRRNPFGTDRERIEFLFERYDALVSMKAVTSSDAELFSEE